MKRFRVFLSTVLAIAVMATSVILGACSGGGGGGSAQPAPKIQLSGTIGSGYSVPAKPASIFAKALSFFGYPTYAYAIAAFTVDKIIAIPMDRGSLQAWNMANTQIGTIDPDTRAFSLSLTKDTDWLLVLINSAGTPTTRFVASVALNTGSPDSMLSLPATISTLTSLNLGSVSYSTGDALTSKVVGTADFSLTTAQITAMAKTDDIFRNAKNIINNYNTATGVYYQLRPDFTWSSDYSTLTTTLSDPAYNYMGMGFQLDTNSPAITMDDLCSFGTTTLKLFPSTDVSDGTYTYNVGNPITNTGASPNCTLVNGFRQLGGTGLYATDAYAEGGVGLSMGPWARFPAKPVTPATWTWVENNVEKAWFDVATINPPVNDDGTPKGFVPAFKINTAPSTTSQIESIDVKWYYSDGASYLPLATEDLGILKHFIGRLEVKLEATTDQRRTCEMYFDPSTTTQVRPADFATVGNCSLTWYFNNDGHPDTNTGLMGFYESGGFGYFFNFFLPI